MIIDVTGQHKAYASILMPLKDGTLHRHPVFTVNTETLDALCVLYAHVPAAELKIARWQTVIVHSSGRYEQVFCDKPPDNELAELIKVQKKLADGKSLIYFCQIEQLDYLAYSPGAIIPFELVDAIKKQGKVNPVRLK